MAETKLISPGIPNYTLKRNLKLNDKYLSNDGGDEGIRISNVGNIGIGDSSPTSDLDIKGNLSVALTGTVSVTEGSAIVTGSSANFNKTAGGELEKGDAIKIGSEVFSVYSITNNNLLALDSNYIGGGGSDTISGLTAYKDSDLFRVSNGDDVSHLVITGSGHTTIAGGTESYASTSGTPEEAILRLRFKATNSVLDIGYGLAADDTAWIQARTSDNYGAGAKALALQPNGGTVAIGEASPTALFHITNWSNIDVSTLTDVNSGNSSTGFGALARWQFKESHEGSLFIGSSADLGVGYLQTGDATNDTTYTLQINPFGGNVDIPNLRATGNIALNNKYQM